VNNYNTHLFSEGISKSFCPFLPYKPPYKMSATVYIDAIPKDDGVGLKPLALSVLFHGSVPHVFQTATRIVSGYIAIIVFLELKIAYSRWKSLLTFPLNLLAMLCRFSMQLL
jgi:hypothetical protein